MVKAEIGKSSSSRMRELGQFLRARRERIAPQKTTARSTTRRRTPGLRREEVCDISGVGLSWYTWLEQGRIDGVTADKLHSLAAALQLSADETTYVFELAGLPHHIGRPQVAETVPARYQALLDTIGSTPGYISNSRWDRIAWNDAAVSLFGDFGADPPRERNVLWRTFTNMSRRRTLRDRDAVAQVILAEFAASQGQFLEERWMKDFVEELLEASPEFREWWPKRGVSYSRDKEISLVHSRYGELRLFHSSFRMMSDAEMTLVLFTPVPGTGTGEKLDCMLADYLRENPDRVRPLR